MPKFGIKNVLFGRFGYQFWKTFVIFEISTLEFSLFQSFVQKIKILRFGTNKANLGLESYMLLSYLKPASLNLSCCKVWCKQQNLEIWDQNALFGYFGARISNSYFHIWNQFPPIFLIRDFCRKTKMSKFGSKNAMFGYSCTKI